MNVDFFSLAVENRPMGRPRKSEMGPIPTRERLLQQAMELFAERGFEAVSVRDITKPLGLTEATLYIHFQNKAALLEAIFQRMKESLIAPGFAVPPADAFDGEPAVEDILIDGARRFFSRAGRETLLTWRILMVSQYRYESARDRVRTDLLEAPARFFAALLRTMQEAGAIRRDVENAAMGRAVAGVFFQYSFRTNLQAAWEGEAPGEFDRLVEELRMIARAL